MKTLSTAALDVIKGYLALPFSHAPVQCPYYNNRRREMRAGLRARIGKGTPEDIVEEALIESLHDKIELGKLSAEELKKFLVDRRLGIDCSGLVYYVLDAETRARGRGSLASNLHFVQARNPWRKLLALLRPVENAGVTTFSSDRNSTAITLGNARPGDYITTFSSNNPGDPAHIILFHKIEYAGTVPSKIYYTHAGQWTTDGRYGHGVREGSIDITDPNGSVDDQLWHEQGLSGDQNLTYLERIKKATTVELRRLKCLA